MRGGFKVEKTVLNRGDILYLYTDGIEESTRRIREVDYSVRQNEVEVKKMNPKTHQEEVEIKLEDAKEEFGPERIQQIIEAVYNKNKFVLSKLDKISIPLLMVIMCYGTFLAFKIYGTGNLKQGQGVRCSDYK